MGACGSCQRLCILVLVSSFIPTYSLADLELTDIVVCDTRGRQSLASDPRLHALLSHTLSVSPALDRLHTSGLERHCKYLYRTQHRIASSPASFLG